MRQRKPLADGTATDDERWLINHIASLNREEDDALKTLYPPPPEVFKFQPDDEVMTVDTLGKSNAGPLILNKARIVQLYEKGDKRVALC